MSRIIFLKEQIDLYGKCALAFLSGLVIMISLFGIAVLTKNNVLSVSFLNVGQGDAIFIETPSGHTMLIDGGPNKKVLSELASTMGFFKKDIDVVVATHPDADHITGLVPVLETFTIKNIVTSYTHSDTDVFTLLQTTMRAKNANEYIAKNGDEINFHDGVRAYILFPRETRIKETNDSSVSMVLVYGEHSFLLTGDLSSKYEGFLINSLLPQHVTVYKAGHHGSKYSSGEQLLSYIKPEYAVISAGAGNRYGHPDEETVRRLTTYAKEILSTITQGRISFTTDGHTFFVETQK